MPAWLAVACIVAASSPRLLRRRGDRAHRRLARPPARAGDRRRRARRLGCAAGRDPQPLISAMLLGGQLVTIAASALATNELVSTVGERGVVYATRS